LPPPQPHPGAAAVFVDELNTGFPSGSTSSSLPFAFGRVIFTKCRDNRPHSSQKVVVRQALGCLLPTELAGRNRWSWQGGTGGVAGRAFSKDYLELIANSGLFPPVGIL